MKTTTITEELKMLADELGTGYRRPCVWLYALRGLSISVREQREELEAYTQHHGTHREALRRLGDELNASPDSMPCLSCNLWVRLRRGDTVLMARAAFEQLPPSVQLALCLTAQRTVANLLLVHGHRAERCKPALLRRLHSEPAPKS